MTTTIPAEIVVARAWFAANQLHIRLEDGRTISAPLAWFPRLAQATPAERGHWDRSADRSGVHWPEVDEDVSARVLMGHAS